LASDGNSFASANSISAATKITCNTCQCQVPAIVTFLLLLLLLMNEDDRGFCSGYLSGTLHKICMQPKATSFRNHGTLT
jgi:hypothetical protein